MGFLFYRNALDRTFPHKRQEVNRPRAEGLAEFTRGLEPGARISTQFDTGAFLPRHTVLYPLRPGYPLQEYILIDLNGSSPFYPVSELEKLKNRLLQDKMYVVFRESQGMILLKRSSNIYK